METYKKETLRYYSNILTAFSKPVLRAIDKLADVPVSIIAPSHGLVWRKDPQRVVEWYSKWAAYAEGPTETGITLVYGSMYGNTERMMNAVAQGIAAEGVPLEIFNVANTHPGYILPALYTQRGVMVGAPTYERKIFPLVANLLNLAVLKEIRHKKTAYFGSCAWGGGALKQFNSMLEELKWEPVGALDFKGGPSGELLEKGKELGSSLARAVKDQ